MSVTSGAEASLCVTKSTGLLLGNEHTHREIEGHTHKCYHRPVESNVEQALWREIRCSHASPVWRVSQLYLCAHCLPVLETDWPNIVRHHGTHTHLRGPRAQWSACHIFITCIMWVAGMCFIEVGGMCVCATLVNEIAHRQMDKVGYPHFSFFFYILITFKESNF